MAVRDNAFKNIKREISDEILKKIKEYSFTPAEIISEMKKYFSDKQSQMKDEKDEKN